MTDSRSDAFLRIAWLMVILLWPVALLNYLDRQMLATMKSSMMQDLPDIAREANWGIVLGSFKWVYALLSPVGGYIADRLSRRHVIAASLFVWSAVTWITAYVTTFPELVATRAVMGISEAFYIPAALALITDFHQGHTRSRAVGIHQTAIYTGLILGGFAGFVADSPHAGWRMAFSVCGVVGVLYSAPLFALLRNAPRRETTLARPSPWVAGRDLLTQPSFLLLVLYFTLPAIAGWVVKDWMPAILQERFHLPQGKAGVNAVLWTQLASLAGASLGGWWADRWMQRSIRGRIYVSAIGTSLFLPALFGLGSAPSLSFAVAFLILYGIGWGCFDCNNMPILCQLVRPELRATGYGIMNLVSISIGGFADWGFGAVRDAKVPLHVVFGVFAGIALLSVINVLLIRPKAANVE
uniref:MFS transporter n=1 Tax=Schlesneria paludicola TaxID=360056 RepID=A0A7C2NXP2_9PLAN